MNKPVCVGQSTCGGCWDSCPAYKPSSNKSKSEGVNTMKTNWNLSSREIGTGQDRYVFCGNELNAPIVLSKSSHHYKVTEFYALHNTLLWLICERHDGDVVKKANLTPDEIDRMDLGFSDDKELDLWIAMAKGMI